MQQNISVLKHVPKAVRNEWASCLTGIFKDIVSNPGGTQSWILLFMLPKCILSAPPLKRHGKRHWRDNEKLVRQRLQRWKKGEFSELWEDCTTSSRHRTVSKQPREVPLACSHPSQNIRRTRAFIEEGRYRNASKALSSLGLAPFSSESLCTLRDKHPRAPHPTLPIGPLPKVPSFTAEEVKARVLSFPNGSAPGPSKLRSSHLIDAISCPSPEIANAALLSLSAVTNTIFAGHVSEAALPYLTSASLFGANKKDGGVRPIAVGETLRRLVSKCAVASVRRDAVSILAPLQLGFGVRGGCESIILAANLCHTRARSGTTFCLVDFQNAFNEVDRSTFLLEVRNQLPAISSWVEACYGKQARPHLFYGKESFLSCQGVMQGDPLGPLIFSLALLPILRRVQEEAPQLDLHCWFLDDGTLCGPHDEIVKAVRILEEECPKIGLTLSVQKTIIWRCDNSPLPDTELSHLCLKRTEGLEILGAPVGSAEFKSRSLMHKVDKLGVTLDKLSLLQDSHMEFVLLRSCLGSPKFTYATRTCIPHISDEATATFDLAQRKALSNILGSPVSDQCWTQASLPVRSGGLGMRQCNAHSIAAYTSALLQNKDTIERLTGSPLSIDQLFQDTEKDLLLSRCGVTFEDLLSEEHPVRYKCLSIALDERRRSAFEASLLTIRSKALFNAVQLPHAGDWLNSVPCKALGLHLLPQEFRWAAQYRLGLPIYADTNTKQICPSCSRQSDPFGDHAVGCPAEADRIHRHDRLRDALFSAAQAAALAPRKEVPHLIPGSQSRPADLFLPAWRRGAPTAVDVTVISPLQSQLVSQSAITPGHSLTVAEARKRRAHEEALANAGVLFLPLPVEATGGWSEASLEFLRDLGGMLGHRAGGDPGTTTAHLLQRLAITLQRGNCALWGRRAPCASPSIDGRL